MRELWLTTRHLVTKENREELTRKQKRKIEEETSQESGEIKEGDMSARKVYSVDEGWHV
jgi:hypothetical protein